MRKVQRNEIVDYATYAEQRRAVQERVFPQKELRRVHLHGTLTFLFENADTIRYQIQEMMRVEKIVREADIRHEIDTYNEILGDDGELGVTLLIEIDDPSRRPDLLRRWRSLPEHLYVRLADDSTVRARFDPRQVGEERLSSVQYLKFPTGGKTPVAVGCDLDDLAGETALTEKQQAALAEDLAS